MSNPDENSGESHAKCGVKNWYENNQRSIIAVALIAVVAFVLRFIFAYGTSVGSGTALSGGTSASEHLHAIVEILEGGTFIGTDGTLNYPFGSSNTNPVLYDLLLTPFALLGKAMGMTSVDAASTALAWGAIIFGVLATVMAYFVGKEFLGEKKHGYLAAAFIAFCPVVITNTVFSNGSEVSFVAFMVMVLSFFLIKGVKNIDTFSMPTDRFSDIFRLNKTAMIYAVISGIVLTIVVLSWNGFRFIANALCVILAIMVLVDRFRSRDSRVVAIYFSIVLLIAMAAATAYYVPSGLWDAVLSGVLISTLLSVAVCVSFASLQKIPWTLTIPVYAIVLIAVFVVLFCFAPDYFNVIFNGNSVYAQTYGSLVSITGLSVSKIATNYGFITVWFPFIMAFMMLWKLPKNVGSPAYVFTFLWACFGIGYGIFTDVLAVIFAPAYALGFAFIIGWLFDNVKFKEYFDAIRASDLRSVWKKLIKPIPFLSIIGVLLLICAPNALYAIDASIPSNDMDDREGLDIGAVNYYIRTDSDWKVNDILSKYSTEDKDGAMLTWSEYAADASTYGGFNVTTDTVGNGAVATSLTLLANGRNNAAVADMTISLIKYKGIDASKDTLIAAGMTAEVYDQIKAVFDSPGDYKSTVINNPGKYGAFDSKLSDESITYAMCSAIMTDAFDAYKIAEFYDAMIELTGKSIDYVMITGDMIPMSYGASSLFSAMGKMAGYSIYDDYGSVSEFVKTDSSSMYFTMYYTGLYSYTESMTDSLLWRSYIGMSPEEAGFTGYYASYNYISGLLLSDGTVKAMPGYGLSNFAVDESSWYVKYNADSKAEVDSDGWVKMLAVDAQELQETNGGLINYLAGYPVVMRYISNDVGTKVSGVVTDEFSQPVKGIRVSVFNENGLVRSTTMTNDLGEYTVVASEGNSISFYAASTNLNDGTLLKSVEYSDESVDTIDVSVQPTSIEFVLVDGDGEPLSVAFEAQAKFVGKNSGVTKIIGTDATTHESDTTDNKLVPDIYDVTVTDIDGKNTYATATVTVVPGVNTMYKIKITMYTVTISMVDDMGVAIGAEYIDQVKMTETTYGTVFTGANDKGTVKIDVIAGTYSYTIEKAGDVCYTDAPVSKVSSNTSVTVRYYDSDVSAAASAITDGKLAVFYAMGYQQSTAHAATALLPTGTAFNASYTVYSVDGTQVLVAKTDDSSAAYVDAVKVSGTLTDRSDNAVSGLIVFILEDGRQIPVSSDKGGLYSVMLPKNTTYTIYAQYGNQVCIEKGFAVAAEDTTKDIKTETGTKVSGNIYWYSSTSSRVMRYVPVTITYDDVEFNLLTDNMGAYSMYIPADATCKIKATVDGSAFFFDTAGTAEQTKTDSTGGDFIAKVTKVTVQNNSGYRIKFSSLSEKTENGASAELEVTSTNWYVTVYQGDNAVLSSVSVPVSVDTIDANYFEVPDYVKVTIANPDLTTNDAVTITPIENVNGDKGEKQTISTQNREYLLEKGTSSLPYEYLVTVKNSDSTKIGYAYLSLDTSDTSDITVNIPFENSFKLSGFVGLSASGTISVANIAVDKSSAPTAYEADISNGEYTITLPVRSANYELLADVQATEGNWTYNYSETRIIPYAEFEAGKEYVRNIAVVGTTTDYDGDVNGNLEVISGGMVDSTVRFKVNIYYMDTSESKDTTYLLSAGSDWIDLRFFADDSFTLDKQISSVVVAQPSSSAAPTIVWAEGKISLDKAGLGTDGLSVNITDINDSSSCVAKFNNVDTAWVKSENKKSSITYGTDAVGKSEYRYAVDITNEDNFTKVYSIIDVAAAEGTITDGWFVTYVNGNTIAASGADLEVLGHETATLYVKITAKDDSQIAVPEITFKVRCDTTGETFYVGAGTEGGITITGDTATVKSVEQTTLIGITDMSAEGRGVHNEYGDTPTYVWVLYGIVIVLTILVLWLGMKRRVLSRKK